MKTKMFRGMLVLLMAALLATALPGPESAASLAAARYATPDPTLMRATEEPGMSVSDEWWAAAQAYIEADIEPGSVHGLSSTPDWSAAGQSDGDKFGYSAASAGDVNGDGYADVIVGAYERPGMFGSGRVYAFYGSATGLSTTPDWSYSAGTDVGLGYAVAGAGDVNGDGYADVVVSAPLSSAAAVYLFFGSASGLSSTWDWKATSEHGYINFGNSVAGAGDVNGDGYADILVGANYYGEYFCGIVYAYYGGASGPGATPDWSAEGSSNYLYLGHAVAGAGDVNGDGYADIIASSVAYASGRGAAYVYHGSASGLPSSPNRTYSGEQASDWFGQSVASAGDVNGDGYGDILVGANGYDATNDNDGRVYAYHGSADGLGLTPAWHFDGPEPGVQDQVGRSVASAGDVNGDGYADVAFGGANRALLFYGAAQGLGAGGWRWFVYGENSDDEFGFSVAGAGDVNGDGYADVLVGAYGYAAGANQGKAYAYHGSADVPSSIPVWNRYGTYTNDEYGWAVASAGDVNGDGYSDVLVGAPGYPAPSQQGRVYLYLGSASGLATTPAWSANGEQDGQRFGASLASAGDVNGDGYADVIIGAKDYDGAQANVGKAYVYHGTASGLASTPAWTSTGEHYSARFGGSVAGAGDVNGDGYADVVVGANDDGHWQGRGAVYVYYGSEASLGLTPGWTASGEQDLDKFGSSVAGAGDVNGDGYADLLVGTPSVGTQQGKAYVYHGSASGPGATAGWSITGLDPHSYFGYSVAGAGDVNGDGYADVLIGALLPPAGDNTGKVYLYTGSASGLGITAAWSQVGQNVGDRFGHALGAAGDVNGDGYADVVIGAYGYDGSRGRVYLYLGRAAGLHTTASMTRQGNQEGDQLGYSVAGAGDVNSDGFAEIVAGAIYGEGSMGVNQGEAFVYLGNGHAGQLVLARPVRQDSSQIQPWGLTGTSDMFEVRMGATNPAGRGRVKLEVEACPPGAAFGTAACTTARYWTWHDTVPVGGLPLPRQLSVTIAGLKSGTLYHWRARVLYAPFTVNQPGITASPNPAHGPWRRFQAQAFEADLRTLGGWQIFLPLLHKTY